MRKTKQITEKYTGKNLRPSVAERLPSHRQKRVSEMIRAVLSEIFARQDFLNTDLINRMLTITHVTISPDLQYAKIYISPLLYAENGEMMLILAALKEEARHLRYQMAQHLTLKYTPQLSFVWDESLAHAAHIDALFERIKKT